MKYYKCFLIILFVVFSCTPKKKETLVNKYDLKGSWSIVDMDSTYYEAFYNDNTYQYYFGDDDYLTNPTKYIIIADTLFSFAKRNNKERRYVNFIVEKENEIFIIEVDKRKTHYIPIDSSEYTLDKIRNKKDFEKFRKAYLSRKYNLIKKGLVRKDRW